MKDEFEFIHYIKKSYGLTTIGDDCAVLPKDRLTDSVVTADMLVEDIDFRLEWTKPEWLGHLCVVGRHNTWDAVVGPG